MLEGISKIAPFVESYLEFRISLGYRLNPSGSVLRNLDIFLGRNADLTAYTFDSWLQTQYEITQNVRRVRIFMIIKFCKYRQRFEPECFIPGVYTIPKRIETNSNYIFTNAQILALLRETLNIRDKSLNRLKSANLRLSIVLLYTTGMRIGELAKLKIEDYNHTDKTLLIRETKFYKSRIIPLSNDASSCLDSYLEERIHLGIEIHGGSALIKNCLRKNIFYNPGTLSNQIISLMKNLHIETNLRKSPRVHDFRHTFAIHRILQWYKDGFDINSKLIYLTIYMGHSGIQSTEHYLRDAGKLTSVAVGLFGKNCEHIIRIDNNEKTS